MLKKLVKGIMSYIGFRVSESEHAIIKEKAIEYTGGNVSEWCRFAAVTMIPSKKDLTK